MPASRRETYRCSFCGKAQQEVGHLIAGPGGVYICNECVELCTQIVAEQRTGTSTSASRHSTYRASLRGILLHLPPPGERDTVEQEVAASLGWLLTRQQERIAALEQTVAELLNRSPQDPDGNRDGTRATAGGPKATRPHRKPPTTSST